MFRLTGHAQKLTGGDGAVEYFVSAHHADDDERKKNAGVITAIVGIMSKGLHYYIASNRAMSDHSLP